MSISPEPNHDDSLSHPLGDPGAMLCAMFAGGFLLYVVYRLFVPPQGVRWYGGMELIEEAVAGLLFACVGGFAGCNSAHPRLWIAVNLFIGVLIALVILTQ